MSPVASRAAGRFPPCDDSRFTLPPSTAWSRRSRPRPRISRRSSWRGAQGPAGAVVSLLGEGGDTSALRDLSGREVTKYDLQGASLLLYVVAGEKPTSEDEQALKLADRNEVDAVCVLVGAKSQPVDIAYVPATRVVTVPPGS